MKALSLLLTLPFMFGLALGMHWFVSRTAKAVAWAAAPLATGEAELLSQMARELATEVQALIAARSAGGHREAERTLLDTNIGLGLTAGLQGNAA